MIYADKRDIFIAWDIETIPCVHTWQTLHGSSTQSSEKELMERIWSEYRTDDDSDDQPFVPDLFLHRVLSMSCVVRGIDEDGQRRLFLRSFPGEVLSPESFDERATIESFCHLLAARDIPPKLIGYNSLHFDISVVLRRSLLLGLKLPRLADIPEAPWKGADYLSRAGKHHIDLLDVLKGGSRNSVGSLDKIATLLGIPGKLDTEEGTQLTGLEVANLWLTKETNQLKRIIAYNECDALTTYLVFLALGRSSLFDQKEFLAEQEAVQTLIETEISTRKEASHLELFLQTWEGTAKRSHEHFKTTSIWTA